MDIFNNSVDGQRKNNISYIQSSNKIIVHDVKLLQTEIGTLKSNIANLKVKIKSLKNYIQQNNKSLLDSESRISELFNNYGEVTTIIGITREDLTRVFDSISHMTQEFEHNSLSDHGLFIAQLHARLKTVKDSYMKKS